MLQFELALVQCQVHLFYLSFYFYLMSALVLSIVSVNSTLFAALFFSLSFPISSDSVVCTFPYLSAFPLTPTAVDRDFLEANPAVAFSLSSLKDRHNHNHHHHILFLH